MALKINDLRITKLGMAFKTFGLENVLIVEKNDPQFKALKHLHRSIEDCGALALLTVLNALVSYQLTSKGEEYWWEFAKWKGFSKYNIRDPQQVVREFKYFLENSTGNRFALRTKISRIDRLIREEFHIELYIKYLEYSRDLEKLVNRLSRILKQEKISKTIVFSAKMFYYTMKICGIPVFGTENIDLPIDRRISLITYTSGIIETNLHFKNINDLINKIAKYTPILQNAWKRISLISNIPPINIDSILWIAGGFVEKRDPIGEAVKYIYNLCNREISEKRILTLIQELFFKKLN